MIRGYERPAAELIMRCVVAWVQEKSVEILSALFQQTLSSLRKVSSAVIVE